MPVSRRAFMRWAAAVSAMAVPRRQRARAATAFRPDLLPDQREVWDHQTWMARLGPKYTGNEAHNRFVDFLAGSMEALRLDVERIHYTFPRWETPVRPTIGISTFGLSDRTATEPRGSFLASSYFPYSGSTPIDGVRGELVYAGTHPNFDLSEVRGRVALVEFESPVREWSRLYQPWGINPPGETFPSTIRPARAAISDLTPFQKAGAIAVIIIWKGVSYENAKDQYTPFSRPIQHIPALYIADLNSKSLREHAAARGTIHVTLVAEVIPDSPTDTVVATLPGATDEVIILNTHTDGPNATEENGAIGLVALAKYFSKIPQSERRRTLVFPMTTGHFASPWVPSIRGFIEKRPEIIKKAVAAVTVEHLGCREWLDDAELHYRATGKNEWSVAITPNKAMGMALVDALRGSIDRAAVVNPVGGGFLGEGNSLSRAGIPTIGYIPQPNYLLAGPADGCIDKLSAELMHSQIQVFAKLVHRLDSMSAEELKG